MSEINFEELGLKVGLEIHQQLATNKKLFCNCSPLETPEYFEKFSRKLRASKSELGQYDPAALFESTKSRTMVYYGNPLTSCLVEKDEEPPHELDLFAKKIALLIAVSLNSKIFKEAYPMRKTVIDGSNTSGFQRTILIAQGGYLEVEGKKIGVQSICLEEDAAKLIGEDLSGRKYSLDRLGIPLVEIALEPISGKPSFVRKTALTLGRLLRTTKMVSRGLGSIRQDVNISIKNSGIVEVKGVQQLDQLEKVIDFESKRQYGLWLISKKLQEKNIEKISPIDDVFDVSSIFLQCKSKIIQNALKSKATIKAIKIRKISGFFGYSPFENIRLGKELGQLVRFFGIGGVFHSDELPNYGIEESEINKIKNLLKLNQGDGFLIIAGHESKLKFAINSLIERIENAKIGIPSETRQATASGETVFLRPKPGASRMYPETDILPIMISEKEIHECQKNIPKSWDESIKDLVNLYKLNPQLAEQIFDSEYLQIFEIICSKEKISPNFIASIFCSTITSLERKGLDSSLLTKDIILKTFEYLEKEEITKESIEIIFEKIMGNKAKSVDEAIKISSIGLYDESKIKEILESIIQKNKKLLDEQGDHAIGTLMGIVMQQVRGKVSGEKVNKLLGEKIQQYLSKNK